MDTASAVNAGQALADALATDGQVQHEQTELDKRRQARAAGDRGVEQAQSAPGQRRGEPA